MEIFLKSHENDLDFEVLARSYDLYGKILHLMNDYSGAMESHQQAIRIRAEKNSRDHVDTASSLTSIGCAYFKLNNEIEAVKSFQSALELRNQLGIYDHVDTANIYYTLGENHFSLDNCEEAIEAHMKALKLRKKHLGEHPRTAESLHDIAVVYCRMSEKGNPRRQKLPHYSPRLKRLLKFTFCEEALAMRTGVIR
ncbi:hypothetical protein OS493_039618 [Desmophyllum pertusum]|uniref:Kinesin light chain n=1 Tax=Desmophyllum pertusum TaxID=174260 RepID=A0A9X0CGR1_9CNID|nr:hypothetical protein OS493_039618 [Desmophyllum pertusum]